MKSLWLKYDKFASGVGTFKNTLFKKYCLKTSQVIRYFYLKRKTKIIKKMFAKLHHIVAGTQTAMTEMK